MQTHTTLIDTTTIAVGDILTVTCGRHINTHDRTIRVRVIGRERGRVIVLHRNGSPESITADRIVSATPASTHNHYLF